MPQKNAAVTHADPTKSNILQIPTGIAPETLMAVLRLGRNGLEDGGPISSKVHSGTRQEVRPPTKIEAMLAPNSRTYIRQNARAGYTASVSIPDIDVLSQRCKALKKWLTFILYKLNMATDAGGNLTTNRIEFSFRELTELGMYTRPDNAKREFSRNIAALTTLKLDIAYQRKNKRGTPDRTTGVLFPLMKTERGKGVIILNNEPEFHWPLILDRYGPLPSFYFRLNDSAADMLYYACFLARQNTDKIAKQGFFNIGLRALQERLILPSEAEADHPHRVTLGRIEQAVDAIEGAQTTDGTAFRFLFVHACGNNASQQLDNGFLRVEVCGEIKDRYLTFERNKRHGQRPPIGGNEPH